MVNLLFLKLSYNNLMRRKASTFVNIFLLVLVMLIIVTAFSITKSVNRFLDDFVLNSPQFRSIWVSHHTYEETEMIEKISSFENVIEVYPFKGNLGAEISHVTGILESEQGQYERLVINPSGITNQPRVLAGRNIESNDSNVGIIPSLFYPKSNANELDFWKAEVDYIDGTSLMGENITIKYYASSLNGEILKEFEYTFEVIGVYDAVAMDESLFNVFVPYGDGITAKLNIEEYSQRGDSPIRAEAMVVVDQTKNVAKVHNELRKLGISGDSMKTVGGLKELSLLIKFVSIIISVIILILGFVIISSNTIRSVKKRNGEIGLLKAIGYSDGDVAYCIFYELILTGVISVGIATVISTIVFVVVNFFINTYLNIYLQGIKVLPSLISILIVLALGVFVPFLAGQSAMRRALEIEPTNALSQL